MKYISQTKAEVFRNDTITSWEYETPSEVLNVARIMVTGRYPEHGYTSNTIADSVIHIIDGQGILGTQDGSRVELTAHDQLHIAIDDAYFFEGNLELLYAATPKWTPVQTKHLR